MKFSELQGRLSANLYFKLNFDHGHPKLRIKTTDKWLDAFRQHALDCPEKIPPEIPVRQNYRDRGFKSVKECQFVSRASR